jgi:hypothetical protein
MLEHGPGSWAARRWHELHPDEGPNIIRGCCYGELQSWDRCTCWTPVFDTEQAIPQVITDRAELVAADTLCGDCAYRPGSPEREDTYTRETLYSLASRDQAFYCHRGMRRPVAYEHPDGRRVESSGDDWTPAIVDSVPYQADGTPGVLCAGWAAQRRRVT